MEQRFANELDPNVKVRMKKNLVYVGIFSIIMIFGAFTSAYIVSMGDSFWVKYPLPSGFWFSTIAIIMSSLFYILAINAGKKEQFKQVKICMVLTFFAGMAFVYFQWTGYGQLVDKGANFRNSILVTDGRYGDYFEIKYGDKFIEVNANDYLLNGKILNENQMSELKSFVKPFENTASPKGYQLNMLNPNFTLFFQGEPVVLQNKKLVTTSGNELKYLDMKRLQFLSFNIRDNRGDFYFKGKLGKDFHIYYKGKELKYKQRNLYFGTKILSAPLQLKINQARDTATSYLYIITILHLLHIIAAMIYLFRMVLISFKKTLTTDNQLSIKLGSIFWHFLGILWLYLLVFLLFIH
jgi:cytochrome c oxidase subunit III